jgi:hypothetical protein
MSPMQIARRKLRQWWTRHRGACVNRTAKAPLERPYDKEQA